VIGELISLSEVSHSLGTMHVNKTLTPLGAPAQATMELQPALVQWSCRGNKKLSCRSEIAHTSCPLHKLITRHSLVERRARYLFYCMFVCLFGQRFLSNPRADSRHILHAGVAWVGTCLLPFWGSATPVGAKRPKMTWGWSHSCIGQLPFLFLSAMPNLVQYVRHRPAHILV